MCGRKQRYGAVVVCRNRGTNVIARVTKCRGGVHLRLCLSTPGWLPVVYLTANFRQEADDFFALKSTVTPATNTARPYSSVVTPTPQRIRMYVEELGYFHHR